MASRVLSDEDFVKRLGKHPALRQQMEAILLSVEDEAGELKTADAAEMRLIEQLRRTGKSALQSWAERRAEQATQEAKETPRTWQEGKKNSGGTAPLVR